ncbi:hypothetical protein [Streptomyces sp. NPDC053069]|uniref:hypothetical protein n=1 Tax=Streptomyces sp. NPDC053069 TaxID=3365695 RepID=UPI0037CE7067
MSSWWSGDEVGAVQAAVNDLWVVRSWRKPRRTAVTARLPPWVPRTSPRRRTILNLPPSTPSSPPSTTRCTATLRATVGQLDHPGFLARLRWMLCEAFSPYGHHYPAADAEQLVRGFPDFLRSTGYYSGEEPQQVSPGS